MSAATTTKPTVLEHLRKQDPRINDWLADVQALGQQLHRMLANDAPSRYCQHDVWVFGYGSYPSFKRRLRGLPLSSGEFHALLEAFHDAIPPCHECGCALS